MYLSTIYGEKKDFQNVALPVIAMVNSVRLPVTIASPVKFWLLPIGIVWLHACLGANLEVSYFMYAYC